MTRFAFAVRTRFSRARQTFFAASRALKPFPIRITQKKKLFSIKILFAFHFNREQARKMAFSLQR
jgi:hypothetical protein